MTEPDTGAEPRPALQPQTSPDSAVDPVAPSRPRRRGYFLPGVIALAALVTIGVAAGAGDLEHRPPPSLLGSDVEQQLSFGIQSQEGLRTPPTVTCPGQEPVRVGLTFSCRIEGSHPRVIEVTEVDGRGHLHWSLAPATP